MPTIAERTLQLLQGGPLDDDELAERLGVVRQQVNQVCRLLSSRGLVVRGVGPHGKIENRLHDAGIHLTFRPASHQWKRKPFNDDAILLGGQLFDARVPEALLELRTPPVDATREERAKRQAEFDRRASYAYQAHTGADSDGFTRWKSPFATGQLSSRQLPHTMRNSSQVPLVELAPGVHPASTITASAADLPLRQGLLAGTTAHNVSMGRRLPVEGVNSDLKGRFVDVDRGFCRVFGTTKTLLMLGFTVAGLNMRTAKRFRDYLARLAGPPRVPVPRPRRREGTLSDLVRVISPPGADPVRGPPSGP